MSSGNKNNKNNRSRREEGEEEGGRRRKRPPTPKRRAPAPAPGPPRPRPFCSAGGGRVRIGGQAGAAVGVGGSGGENVRDVETAPAADRLGLVTAVEDTKRRRRPAGGTVRTSVTPTPTPQRRTGGPLVQRKQHQRGRETPVTPLKMPNGAVLFCDTALQKGVRNLRIDFINDVREFVDPRWRADAFAHNTLLNRYKDVVCGDYNRVKLSRTDGGVEYIHANYILDSDNRRRFICTQGPKEETKIDFWRMVVQEKVTLILMLCQLVEANRKKCAEYWPKGRGMRLMIGDEGTGMAMCVENLDQRAGLVELCNGGEREVEAAGADEQQQFVTTTLRVVRGPTATSQIVQHIQWTSWPDRAIPSSTTAALHLLAVVKQHARPGQSPVVVHCSAGVGRTGTIVAIDLGREMLLSNYKIDGIELIRRLRQQRYHSVQTEQQFVFVHKCLLDYFVKRDRDFARSQEDALEVFDAQFADYVAKLAPPSTAVKEQTSERR